ncbi:uncharacterized protein A4U43_C03F2280 [Asparagus officinalis]|uniref:Major facilitator superfamily (MFS) profile domain-containing protein n=1 Tax=Asparagus officinalis TaxID=4686 RepID=A0A5P1FBP0_ASPOF|nr:uncharacterized protein A4U43_C03F2280 [Asparagus officinalis]
MASQPSRLPPPLRLLLHLPHLPATPFLRFQRRFLFLYSLSSVMQGLEPVLGEEEFVNYGIGREEMVMYLAAGAAAALFLGSVSGMVSDIVGPRKACLLFCVLHLLMGIMKSLSNHPSIWITSICPAVASSMFLFCFETWMVNEHEKQGHRQDLLNETFWLMTFFESVSLIGSQGIANFLVKDLHKAFVSPSASTAIFATMIILYIMKEWKGDQKKSAVVNYRKSFVGHILKDKRTWLLAWAQTSIYFSMSVFWLLWSPTIVGDGRVVSLSLIYPCFLGSKMFGSTIFPWFFGRASSLYIEDCLIYTFIVAALSLLVVAYDYQEIGLLVVLFCIFHACVGFILPSLARLRTIYVPNEMRGGMISLSLAPANAAIWFILIQRGYYHNFENAGIFTLAVLGLGRSFNAITKKGPGLDSIWPC